MTRSRRSIDFAPQLKVKKKKCKSYPGSSAIILFQSGYHISLVVMAVFKGSMGRLTEDGIVRDVEALLEDAFDWNNNPTHVREGSSQTRESPTRWTRAGSMFEFDPVTAPSVFVMDPFASTAPGATVPIGPGLTPIKTLLAVGDFDREVRGVVPSMPTTLLMKAVETNQLKVVEQLIEKGVDLDVVQLGDHGSTALIIAARDGYAAIAAKLVAAGANVNYADHVRDPTRGSATASRTPPTNAHHDAPPPLPLPIPQPRPSRAVVMSRSSLGSLIGSSSPQSRSSALRR